jgi:hypothetical protein
MKIKKSPIYLIVAALISIILVTGSPFQITNDLVNNNGNLSIKNIGQVSGEEEGGRDDDGRGSDESDDSGDSDESDDSRVEESDDSSDEPEENSDNEESSEEEEEHEDTDGNGYTGSVTVKEDGTKEPLDESDPDFEWDDEDGYKTEQQQKEDDYLSEENVDRSITYPGENEATETEEERESEEGEFIADLEDDLADAGTPEEKERIQGLLDEAKKKFD